MLKTKFVVFVSFTKIGVALLILYTYKEVYFFWFEQTLSSCIHGLILSTYKLVYFWLEQTVNNKVNSCIHELALNTLRCRIQYNIRADRVEIEELLSHQSGIYINFELKSVGYLVDCRNFNIEELKEINLYSHLLYLAMNDVCIGFWFRVGNIVVDIIAV